MSVMLDSSQDQRLRVGSVGPTVQTGDYSMFAIVRFVDEGTNAGQIMTTGGENVYRHRLIRNTTTGRLQYTMDSVAGYPADSDSLKINSNQWYAVAAAIDPGNDVTLYLREITDSNDNYNLGTVQSYTTAISGSPLAAGAGTYGWIGCDVPVLSGYMWNGWIEHAAYWDGTLISSAEFTNLSRFLTGKLKSWTDDPNTVSNLECWVPFTMDSAGSWPGKSINDRSSSTYTDWTGNFTITPQTGGSEFPVHDLPPVSVPGGLVQSVWSFFAESRASAFGRPMPRNWPYPYKAGYTIASDTHNSLTISDFIDLLAWFNTTSSHPTLGAGLGIPFSASFWAYVNELTDTSVTSVQNAMGYYSASRGASPYYLSNPTETADAPKIRQLIKDGILDTLHGYGDFGDITSGALGDNQNENNPNFDPANDPARLNTSLTNAGLTLPEVWVNHGTTTNKHNIGDGNANWIGDDNASTHEHIGTTRGFGGAKFFWEELTNRMFMKPDLIGEAFNIPTIVKHTFDDTAATKAWNFRRYNPTLVVDTQTDGEVTVAGSGSPPVFTFRVPQASVSGWTLDANNDILLILDHPSGHVGLARIGSRTDVGGTHWDLTCTCQHPGRGGMPSTGPSTSGGATDDYKIFNNAFANSRIHDLGGGQLDSDLLDQLEANGDLAILYTHVEYFADESMTTALAALRALAARYWAGTLWIAELARFLWYVLIRNFLTYKLSVASSEFTVTIDTTFPDDQLGTITLTDKMCQGLTFFIPSNATCVIKRGTSTLTSTQNPADATGEISQTVDYVPSNSILFGETKNYQALTSGRTWSKGIGRKGY